jgi:preprotein translocase subunit SecG
MNILLTIVHVFVCLFLVGVVLLQSGRAGGMGVLSGAATQTVFGGRGAGGFLAKATAVCATLFMLTSASLAYMSTSTRDVLARQTGRATPPPARPTTPATNVSLSADAAAPGSPRSPRRCGRRCGTHRPRGTRRGPRSARRSGPRRSGSRRSGCPRSPLIVHYPPPSPASGISVTNCAG